MYATEAAALAAGPRPGSVGLYYLPTAVPQARYQWCTAVDLDEDELACVPFELVAEL
jgi:hypothetical protein